jgi:hypothetical protein
MCGGLGRLRRLERIEPGGNADRVDCIVVGEDALPQVSDQLFT